MITVQAELEGFLGALCIIKEAMLAVDVTVSVDYGKHVSLNIVGHFRWVSGNRFLYLEQ